MIGPRPSSPASGVGPGLWAGGTAGLLTGVCYVFLFGGLDFSRGRPFALLLSLPSRLLVLCAALVAAGALVGAFLSLRSPDV